MSDSSETVRAPPRRRRRWLRVVAGITVVLAVFIGAGAIVLSSHAALQMVVGRAIAASEGRLVIEGAEGSLLSTVRVARIAWRGDDVYVEANDIALTWSVTDLLSRRFNVTGLGAHRLGVTLKASGDAAIPLPSDLVLPLEVNVRNVGVERLDWRVGTRAGTITGVAFDYAGGARTHSVEKLRLVTGDGTLEGRAEIGAQTPFPLQAALVFTGDGAFRDTRADASASGTLASVALAAQGTSRDAAIAARARLAPFAQVPLVEVHVDARDVDVARFDNAFPATRLTVTIDAKPQADGLAGTMSAQNTDAGAIDAGRVPLTRMTSRFAWDSRVLALDEIDARLPGDARVTGSAMVPADGSASSMQLVLRDLDLHRVHSTLIATRLTGRLSADVAQAKQSVRAELAQADLSIQFAATVTGRRVDVERFRGRAGAGEVTGRGRATFDSERAFDVTAEATRFDPSRFGAFPAGSLTGAITAHGQIRPSWNAGGEITLAQGSVLSGLAVSGTVRADATAKSVRNVAANVAIATAKFSATGAAGTPGDKLAFAADAPKIAELRSVLAKYGGVAVPETVAGALHVNGTLTCEPGGNGLELAVRGDGLQWGTLRAGTLDTRATIAPGGLTIDAAANASRTIGLTLRATTLSIPQGDFASISVDGSGTPAHHTVAFAFAGEDVDARVRFAGGLREAGAPSLAWAGSLEALDNKGAYAMQLEAPAAIEWSSGHLHIGAAHLRVAEGRADLDDLRWDAGKIATRGAFSGVPLAVMTHLAGIKSPLGSTLVIAGDFSIAASPQLNGIVRVRRERGDLFGTESVSPEAGGLALGITTLDVEARFVDDSATATGTLRSLRAGNADAKLRISAMSQAVQGHIARDAPLTASLVADLPSLRPLQPWLGTLAVVDGRAHVDLAASGTLANIVLAGTLTADAVRVDIPQYGAYWHDGRLRARIADNALTLEELSFQGGDGRFTAQGTLARAPRDGSTGAALAAGRVTWMAEKFRAVNRPDFHLTVGGNGVMATEGGKLAVRGSVKVEQGRIDYEPPSVGTLSQDVVIAGRPRAAANATGALEVPLLLDLDVALGDDLRFVGEGLDTGLAGTLRVASGANNAITARGTIRAVNGTYFILGQRLEIDHGQLIFDGPADNPAIDVVALRKNLAVEAGVEVTGTVRVPRVRLVSNPPVPDGEKLSWLMTGQGLDRASRADLAALGSASASLLGKGQKPFTTTVANTFGLDDISLRERTSTVTTGTTSQVVAFGKRINERLTLVYEQGLTVANNALRIEYALTRTLTLRAEAGIISSLGLYFRRSYD